MNTDPNLAPACPACGAKSEHSCRTLIGGIDVGWTHDARVYAALVRGRPVREPALVCCLTFDNTGDRHGAGCPRSPERTCLECGARWDADVDGCPDCQPPETANAVADLTSTEHEALNALSLDRIQRVAVEQLMLGRTHRRSTIAAAMREVGAELTTEPGGVA